MTALLKLTVVPISQIAGPSDLFRCAGGLPGHPILSAAACVRNQLAARRDAMTHRWVQKFPERPCSNGCKDGMLVRNLLGEYEPPKLNYAKVWAETHRRQPTRRPACPYCKERICGKDRGTCGAEACLKAASESRWPNKCACGRPCRDKQCSYCLDTRAKSRKADSAARLEAAKKRPCEQCGRPLGGAKVVRSRQRNCWRPECVRARKSRWDKASRTRLKMRTKSVA